MSGQSAISSARFYAAPMELPIFFEPSFYKYLVPNGTGSRSPDPN